MPFVNRLCAALDDCDAISKLFNYVNGNAIMYNRQSKK